MSSLINKVKDAISSDHKSNATTSHHDSTTLNTNTDTAAAEPRTDSSRAAQTAFESSGNTHDRSYNESDNYALGHESNRGVDGPASKTDGPHKSNLMNKLDPRVDSDGDRSKNLGANPGRDATTDTRESSTATGGRFASTSSQSEGVPSGKIHSSTNTATAGGNTASGYGGSFDPSGSHVASDSDPRIDPEMNYTQQSHGTGGLTGASNAPSSGRFDSSNNNNNIPEGTFGHHSSRLANAADPRVDSDLDSRSTRQTTRTNLPSGATGATRSAGQDDSISEGTFGHHNSRFANAADPRVDSDLDGGRTQQQSTSSGVFGTTTSRSRTHGLSEGTSGPHSSRAANAADPRVDSDFDRSENQQGFTHGTEDTTFASSREPGPAPGTAGPHKSDMLNKADPRVDSNMDGSKTYGGNKTYDQGSASGHTGRDPRDATQVPPSVMQKHVGQPSVEHGNLSQ